MRVDPPTSTTSPISAAFKSCIPQCLMARLGGALQDRLDELLQLRASDLAAIKSAVRQRDLDARTIA